MGRAAILRPRPRSKPKLGVFGGVWRPRRRITEWSGMDKFYVALEVWTDAEWAELADAERPEEYRRRRLPGIGWYVWSIVNVDEARRIKEEYEAIRALNPHWY